MEMAKVWAPCKYKIAGQPSGFCMLSFSKHTRNLEYLSRLKNLQVLFGPNLGQKVYPRVAWRWKGPCFWRLGLFLKEEAWDCKKKALSTHSQLAFNLQFANASPVFKVSWPSPHQHPDQQGYGWGDFMIWAHGSILKSDCSWILHMLGCQFAPCFMGPRTRRTFQGYPYSR